MKNKEEVLRENKILSKILESDLRKEAFNENDCQDHIDACLMFCRELASDISSSLVEVEYNRLLEASARGYM